MARMLRRIIGALGRGSRAVRSSRASDVPSPERADAVRPKTPTGASIDQVPHKEPALTRVEMHRLDEPVHLFGGISAMPLVDMIEALLFAVDQKQNPCGLERYAARLYREIDLETLRTASLKTSLDVARIERTESLYLNFDRSDLEPGELAAVLATEAAMNRVLSVLGRLDMGMGPISQSPCEEDCARLDALAWLEVTGQVADIMKTAGQPNRWAKRGSVACKPGGEWDVRTRFADIAERIKLPVRLDYTYNVNAAAGEMWARFVTPPLECVPRAVFDSHAGAWKELDATARQEFLCELQARMALVLAASCFASGLLVERCRVSVDAPADAETLHRDAACFAFERAEFMARLLHLAHELDGTAYMGAPCCEALSRVTEPHMAKDAHWADFEETRTLPPAQDDRAFPENLRRALLADCARELEVMEDPQEPYMQRVRDLRELAEADPASAAQGYADLIEELEATCVVRELDAKTPVESQFCENYMARLLLPLTIEDTSVRILPVPDALYFAQDELCDMYAATGDPETALREARKLYDMAQSSMHAHSALVSALASLERFDEVIEVAKHGLRLIVDRSAIGYLFYRVAFAYWQTGEYDLALACYRMVPAGEVPWSVARDEMRTLMAEMGREEEPTFRWALDTIVRNGLEAPPSRAATEFITDLAIQLVDEGFFFLATRCVTQLRSIEPSDELGVVGRSLQN